MTVDGKKYYVDSSEIVGPSVIYALKNQFTSLLRGKVTAINTDLLLYDRWSVGSEV
jgi:hypothetical protein